MVTMWSLVVLASFLCAALPAWQFARNFYRLRSLPRLDATDVAGRPAVSVLIPARNEQRSIRGCLESIQQSRDVRFEIVVLDDQSEDETAGIVREISQIDPRVRLAEARPLPAGWCGKQHACAQLSELARHDVFLFLDADVRLAPDALARLAEHFEQFEVDLLSGVPRQQTVTIFERLLIPLIHFILFGFLSLRRMRRSRHPAYGAGCGQLFLTHRAAYQKSGGHAAIRESLHDGVKLPRLYRAAGLATDLFDATDVASCRMYRSASEVWFGLSKNATEGVATPALVGPATLLLAGGQILPFVLAFVLIAKSPLQIGESRLEWLVLASCVLAWSPRFAAAWRFRQSWLSALLHPLGVLLFLAIQWYALVRGFWKRPVSWKNRPYPA